MIAHIIIIILPIVFNFTLRPIAHNADGPSKNLELRYYYIAIDA